MFIPDAPLRAAFSAAWRADLGDTKSRHHCGKWRIYPYHTSFSTIKKMIVAESGIFPEENYREFGTTMQTKSL